MIRRLARRGWRSVTWVLFACFVALVTLVLMDWGLRFTPSYALFGVPYLPTLPGYFRSDPAIGFDIQENFPPTPVTLRGGGVTYRIWSNSLGCFDQPYRGEVDYVLLVGDSYSHAYAPFDKKWGTLLESLLGVRVLKCGVMGFGTRHELLKARRIIAQLGRPPKLIVVGYFANDLYDDHVFPQATVFHGSLVGMASVRDDDPDGTVVRRDPAELSERERRWRRYCIRDEPARPLTQPLTCWLTRHSILYNLAVGQVRRVIGTGSPTARSADDAGGPATPRPVNPDTLAFEPIESRRWLRSAWERHLQNLLAFRKLASEQGAGLLVVMIPSREQVYPFFRAKRGLSPRLDYEQPARLIAQTVRDGRTEVVDLSPSFRRHADPSLGKREFDAATDLYLRVDNHLSERGERLAALAVARHILVSGLLEVGDAGEKLRFVDELIDRLGKETG